MKTLKKATIYWDHAAGADAGWAYRFRYDDGSEDSGPVEGQAEIDCRSGFISRALETLAHVPAEQCEYHSEEGGYCEWEHRG